MKIKTHKKAGYSAILFCIALFAVLFFASMGNTALVANAASVTNPYLLSQMTEQECIEFIVDSGVEIPVDFDNSPELGSLVKGIITDVESNPEYEFIYSYYITSNFAESIKIAVNEYYGLQGVHQGQQGQSSTMAAAAYTLQDSTFWSNSGYMSYNCYAYSIGRNENPPQYITQRQYQPGDFSNTYFSMSLSIYQMAQVVQNDLQTLGYSDISITTTQPSVQTGENLICIRKGSSDYHFMRYDSGNWYHKPGFTSILKYNYQPTNSRVWIGEYVDLYGNPGLSSTTYISDIYFIKYGKPFTISILNNSVTITGVKQGITLSGSVTIPSTINGMPVVSIGNSAFANQAQLSQITIPASISYVGSVAFGGCSNLTITLERSSIPASWGDNWNWNRPVIFTIPGGCMHLFEYTSLNSTKHRKLCSLCGDYADLTHSTYYSPIYNSQHISTSHRKRCTECSYEKIEPHIKVNNRIICCVIGGIMKTTYDPIFEVWAVPQENNILFAGIQTNFGEYSCYICSLTNETDMQEPSCSTIHDHSNCLHDAASFAADLRPVYLRRVRRKYPDTRSYFPGVQWAISKSVHWQRSCYYQRTCRLDRALC